MAVANSLAVIPENLRGQLATLPPEFARALAYVTPEMLAGCTTAEEAMEILKAVAEGIATDDQANYIPAVYTINHKTQRFQDDAGDAIKGPFRAVILHFQPTRAFFVEGRKLPLCSSIGTLLNGTAPADAQEAWSKYALFNPAHPLKWAGGTNTCATCPFNEFGSDPKTGAGKACKEKYRLFLALADGDGQLTGEGVMANVPTTSMKNWDTYVSHLKRNKTETGKLQPLTTLQVVSEFTLERAQGQGQDYAKMTTKAARPLTPDEFRNVYAIRQQIVKVAEHLGVEVGESFGEEQPGGGSAGPATGYAESVSSENGPGF